MVVLSLFHQITTYVHFHLVRPLSYQEFKPQSNSLSELELDGNGCKYIRALDICTEASDASVKEDSNVGLSLVDSW